MFGYKDPLRQCEYVGGTMQSFVWTIVKGILIFMLLMYLFGY